MGLMASNSGGGDFEMAPVGLHVARCYRVVDLGTQVQTWQGQEKKAHKVMISWELLGDQKMQDGQPFSVHSRFTVSLHPKSQLRPFLESWRGKPFSDDEEAAFNLGKLVGAYCALNVIHSEDGKYANVAAVTPLFKDMKKPAPVNKDCLFDLENPDMEVMASFSEKLQETIMKSPEWQQAKGGSNQAMREPGADEDEDVF